MRFPRSSGILVHPTSFPSPYGIGDLGDGAYRFIDFLVSCNQSLWQILPLGPTGYGDSPYQAFSAFAGNPLLISPELLIKAGWLPTNTNKQTEGFSNCHEGKVTGGPKRRVAARQQDQEFLIAIEVSGQGVKRPLLDRLFSWS